MLSTWLSGFGLAFGVVGALLMFRFGVPAYTAREKEGEGVIRLEQSDDRVKQNARRSDRWAKRGAGLLVVGFALQFAGLVCE